MNLSQFIQTYQDAITQAVLRTYPPVYTARNRDEWGFDLSRLRRRPLGAQGDAIRAVAVSLRQHRGTNLVGEMGTGKTTIGAAAAHLVGFRSVLVLCPPHLVRKWQREIVATVPLARTAIVTSVSDLNQLRRPDGAPLYAITLATGGISSLGVWLMYRASRSADADARGVFNDFIAEHNTGPTGDTYTFETRDAADGSEHDDSGLDHDDETAFDDGG